MFDRLKSLPLTIVLTILIWMYAESQVNSSRGESQISLADVPVWVSGPPDLLARYNVELHPPTVNLIVSGTPDQIDILRGQPKGHASGIALYLDISPDDRPGNALTYRTLRPVLPPGMSVLHQSPQVAFSISESPQPPIPPHPAGAPEK